MVFHPTRSFLITGSSEGVVKYFDYTKQTAKRAFRVVREQTDVRTLAIHPSGDYLLVGVDHPIVSWLRFKSRTEFVFRLGCMMWQLQNTILARNQLNNTKLLSLRLGTLQMQNFLLQVLVMDLSNYGMQSIFHVYERFFPVIVARRSTQFNFLMMRDIC
jgi:WD40 repeat protein